MIYHNIYISIKIFFVFTHILDLLSLSFLIFKPKDVICVSEKHGMSISSHVFRNRERHKITHCYFFSLAMNILCLFLLSRLNKHEIIGSFILHQCTFYRNSYIEYYIDFPISFFSPCIVLHTVRCFERVAKQNVVSSTLIDYTIDVVSPAYHIHFQRQLSQSYLLHAD